MKRIAELQKTLKASERAARRQSAPFPRRSTKELSDAQAFWRALTPPLMLSCPAMPDEKESFSLAGPSQSELRLLALGNDSIRTSLNQSNHSKVAEAAPLHLSLLKEIFEFYQGRIIDLGTAGLMRPVDPRARPFQELKLGEIGQYLYQAMDLGEMSRSEYSDICSALSALSS